MVKARKVNLLNTLLIATVILCLLGLILVLKNKTPINKAIKGEETIAIEVLIQDTYTNTVELFQIGEETSLTVRHKPHKKLKIINVEERPKLHLSFDRTGGYTNTSNEIANYNNLIVTLQDTATITEDGYVIGNIKAKIGNPIELESFKYKLNGKIINIYPLKMLLPS